MTRTDLNPGPMYLDVEIDYTCPTGMLTNTNNVNQIMKCLEDPGDLSLYVPGQPVTVTGSYNFFSLETNTAVLKPCDGKSNIESK